MTYTVQEVRAAKIKLLKASKKLLNAEQEFFLCIALMTTEETLRNNKTADLFEQASYELREYIQKVLGGEITLDGWLRKQPNINYYTVDTTKARVRWAQWMINCLKEAK